MPDVDPQRRRQLGAWYTPEQLVAHLVDEALHDWPRLQRATTTYPLRVLDPACGDGRFLAALVERLGPRCRVVGVDLDPGALASARERLGASTRLVLADALRDDWGAERVDLVVGNPPFLNQLAAATTRGGASEHGGGPYADAAVEFLSLGHRLAEPDGGRVALVLPLSLLASRDAAPVRERVATGSAIRACWWSERSVFEGANVRTCAIVLERGAAAGQVRRSVDLPAVEREPVEGANRDARSWAWLVADELGAPAVDSGRLRLDGVLGDRATVRADFRNQYYGLVGAVHDEGDGPALVTSGLIDPARCRWGERPVRFAGRRYDAPRVHLDELSPQLVEWTRQRLVPKVLVASQTKVIEAVADPDGAWLPSVPVISVIPGRADLVWECAAVLTAPVASAWLAGRNAGTGLSARALRVSAPELSLVPWPAGDLSPAVAALRAGDVVECGRHITRAYGLDPDGGEGSALLGWWRSALPRGGR